MRPAKSTRACGGIFVFARFDLIQHVARYSGLVNGIDNGILGFYKKLIHLVVFARRLVVAFSRDYVAILKTLKQSGASSWVLQ